MSKNNKIEIIEEDKSKKRNLKKEFLDLLKDLVVIVLIVIFIRSFLVMPFQINGSSMSDSYYDREFIIVDRFSYLKIPLIKNGNPDRGDVVVFRPHVSKSREYYIKRVIGLPGDTIKIDNGKVYLLDKEINKFIELNEGYLSNTNKDSTFVRGENGGKEYLVPENSYFVMGDNRNGSTDSRACFQTCLIEGRSNFIVKSDIIGKILIDLGYFNIINSINFSPFEIKFGTFSFMHPALGIDTHPKWFSSPSHYEYK